MAPSLTLYRREVANINGGSFVIYSWRLLTERRWWRKKSQVVSKYRMGGNLQQEINRESAFDSLDCDLHNKNTFDVRTSPLFACPLLSLPLSLFVYLPVHPSVDRPTKFSCSWHTNVRSIGLQFASFFGKLRSLKPFLVRPFEPPTVGLGGQLAPGCHLVFAPTFAGSLSTGNAGTLIDKFWLLNYS